MLSKFDAPFGGEAPVLDLGDGQKIPVADLPPEVQELLQLFAEWEAEKTQAIKAVKKVDAALRSLSLEITSRVHAWKDQHDWYKRPPANE